MTNPRKYNFGYMVVMILLLGVIYVYSDKTGQSTKQKNIPKSYTMKAYLKFSNHLVTIKMDPNNVVAKEVIKNMPIHSVGHNIGGEVYFRTKGVDIKYNGNEKHEFEVGDVTYWRSPDGENKFAIAIFYGNTQYSNWEIPRASSPCVKIGRIVSNIEAMKLAKADEEIDFFLENNSIKN